MNELSGQIIMYGHVAEWSIAAVLKTVGGVLPVGSNPTVSARWQTQWSNRNHASYQQRP